MTEFTRLNEPLAECVDDTSEADHDRRQAEEGQAELDASGPTVEDFYLDVARKTVTALGMPDAELKVIPTSLLPACSHAMAGSCELCQDIDTDELSAFSPAIVGSGRCGCDEAIQLGSQVGKLKSEIRWRDALLDEICRWAVAGNNAEVAAMFRGRNRG